MGSTEPDAGRRWLKVAGLDELAEEVAERTVTDVMAETLVNFGVCFVWGMVGHSNLGLADAELV